MGYINRKGEVVIAPAFRTFYIERSYGDFVDGLATLLGPDGEAVIDEKGTIQSGERAGTGVRLNGKWGFIDRDHFEVTRFEFEGPEVFRRESCRNELWPVGVHRSEREDGIPNRFSDALAFSDVLAAVEEGVSYEWKQDF